MGFGSKIRINNTDHSIASSLYGTCTDSAGTVGKAVTCADFDNLITGVTIHVKFTYGNTATNPTLNVNGTGAKAIYSNGTTAPGNTKLKSWYDNTVVSFTYDGTAWCMNDVGAGLTSAVTDILNLVYPVGSIYMSVNSTSPATLFGGTWTQIQDTFLLAAGTNHAAASTGGAETVTLATENLPSHNHGLNSHVHGLNSHVHSVGAHAHGLNSHVHGLNSHTHTGPSHTHGLNSHTHSIPALSGTAASEGAHYHEMQYADNTGNLHFGFNYTTNDKAKVSTSQYGAGCATAGAHTHTVTTGANTTGAASGSTAAGGTGNTGAATGNTAAATGNTANSTAFNTGAASGNTAAASGNTANTGSGTAVNKMPPYLAVYVWKRTA